MLGASRDVPDAVEFGTLNVAMPASPQRGAQIPSTAINATPDPPQTVAFYEFENFRIDVQRHRLLRDGEPVAIKPKALETLLVLVEQRGRVVTKEELMSRLWPDTAVEEANLTQNVFVARKALGEAPGEQRFIATVARHGYRFVADVSEVQTPDAPANVSALDSRGPSTRTISGSLGTDPSTRANSGSLRTGGHRPRSWRSVVLIAITTLGALMATIALWDRRQTAGPTAPIRSMAVLPFRNLSPDIEQNYFADGMTEAVITDLASISALRVVSHQSVRRYRDSALSMGEIARELGVDAVIEGSVGRTERRIRLTAQLIDARTDQHLWAASYDRELDDVLALQGELARAVAGTVRVLVSEPERSALATRRTVNPDAYDAYLRGRYFFAQRSEQALGRSIEHYRQAIDRDPTFAPAYAGLALAYGPLGFFGYIRAAEARSQLRAAAEKALELDPSLIDAEVALAAATVLYDWDWIGAERAYTRVLERNPNQAQARLWYGFLLQHTGRVSEALVERERALAAEPLSLQFNTSVADTLTVLGRYDDAIARYRRTLELDPRFTGAHQGLGIALLRAGQNDEAIRALQETLQLVSDPRSVAVLGQAYGIVGRSADAHDILEQLERRARDRYLSPVYLAFVHAGLGDRDAAFARLEEAFRDRSPMLTGAKVDPLLEPLRGDPRFANLLRRMSLPVP
jgi:TolB-like protein/DNA-binding winged helix-turn-helix (wHTH) protein/Flp pilus assembly protein TadD